MSIKHDGTIDFESATTIEIPDDMYKTLMVVNTNTSSKKATIETILEKDFTEIKATEEKKGEETKKETHETIDLPYLLSDFKEVEYDYLLDNGFIKESKIK